MNFLGLAAIPLLLCQSSIVFETDLLPSEGKPIYEASGRGLLKLREAPSTNSQAAEVVKVHLGQRLSYDQQRYKTIRPGRIDVLSASRIVGRLLGSVARLSVEDYYSDKFRSTESEVKLGSNFEYLQDHAEGGCFIRINGNVVDADPCPATNAAEFKVVTEPATEEWIHVVVGASSGWLRADANASVKMVGREF